MMGRLRTDRLRAEQLKKVELADLDAEAQAELLEQQRRMLELEDGTTPEFEDALRRNITTLEAYLERGSKPLH